MSSPFCLSLLLTLFLLSLCPSLLCSSSFLTVAHHTARGRARYVYTSHEGHLNEHLPPLFPHQLVRLERLPVVWIQQLKLLAVGRQFG